MLLEQTQTEKKTDPRIKRTRELIQRALMELMAEKSFEAITVQDIAERATINRVTFYAHFADKYALLECSMREMIRQQLRSQVPEDSQFSTDNLVRLIQTVCNFVGEMNHHCRPPHGQLEPLMEKQIKMELYEVLLVWLTKLNHKKANHRPSLEQVAMVTSWAIYGAVVQWSQQERREPAQEFAMQVLPLILASLQLAVKNS